VSDLHRDVQAVGEGVYAVPTGAHVKDNEQVFHSFSSLHNVPLVLPSAVVCC